MSKPGSGKPPSNMTPQRGGTPRNTASPPPDLPPQPYSRPPRTQSYRYGGTANSPPAVEDKTMKKQGMGPDPKPKTGTMAQKPTGTVVPERRDAKGDVMPRNWSLSPDPQGPDARGSVGYKPPKRG